ncbi:hypothetical protein J2046_000587 [Rhizobium petrolearium]|uniref:hypothetical protein n=1 Tax=Neorhizobium petrolearium TaxID=515361 RepID=UPI001AE5BAE1|nr:hypothetical protein [Neorhizobium petrolearium]MBP1842343.1 hypothetical protein [Neorhizobium petrolearium]
MPKEAARILASDTTVTTEELEAIICYLNQKLDGACSRNEPVPFLAYRNRTLFQAVLNIRRSESARRNEV